MILKAVPFSTHTVADAVALTVWKEAVMVAGVALRSFPVSSPPAVTDTVPLSLVQVTLPVTVPAEVWSVLVP